MNALVKKTLFLFNILFFNLLISINQNGVQKNIKSNITPEFIENISVTFNLVENLTTETQFSVIKAIAQEDNLKKDAVNCRSGFKNHFVIITPSYNNAGYTNIPGLNRMRTCDFNLRSVMVQEPGNFSWEMLIIDDKSPDNTGYYAEQLVKQYNLEEKIKVQINSTRKLALQNLWEAILSCDDEDIVVILDGDDALAHTKVLSFLNNIYTNKDVWITYGQYRELHSGHLGFNQPMPDAVVRNNSFRRHPTLPTHLRTFKAWLAKKINPEHLKVTPELAKSIGDQTLIDKYFPMTYDMALMIPMMEMACRGHFRFVPNVLYLYNDSNPISDHRVNKNMQRQIDLFIRNLPSYQPL